LAALDPPPATGPKMKLRAYDFCYQSQHATVRVHDFNQLSYEYIIENSYILGEHAARASKMPVFSARYPCMQFIKGTGSRLAPFSRPLTFLLGTQ
jgi:hypothetical protein